MNQYMLILPSNSDVSRRYPQNRPSNFVTKLFEPLNLGIKDWEAKLVDVSYPSSWANVDKDYKFTFVIYVKEVERLKRITGVFTVPLGYYDSESELLSYIGTQMEVALLNIGLKQHIFHQYDSKKKISHFETYSAVILLHCNETMNPMTMLGFENASININREAISEALQTKKSNRYRKKNEQYNMEREIERAFVSDEYFIITAGHKLLSTKQPTLRFCHQMFIEADIIRDINIGTTRAPIMSSIQVDHVKHGMAHMYSFPVETWLPVNRTHIDTIRIKILDQDRNEITFNSGLVIVRICLRTRSIL